MGEMINKTACAYKEIYEIFKILPNELVNKIPQDTIDSFYKNMDNTYEYTISKESFNEQNMLEETIAILVILFRDYWATPEEKEILTKSIETFDYLVEKKKQIKFNPNNMFKNNNINIPKNLKQKQSITKYKEPLIKKIINLIKKIFNKK